MSRAREYLTVVVVLGMCQGSSVVYETTASSEEINFAEKREIIRKIAENVSKSLNPELDPCDDFLEHVCSNYDENTFHVRRRLSDRDIKDIIQALIKQEEHPHDAEEKMLQFLQSCEQAANNLNFTEMFEDILPMSVHSWPVFNPDWNDSLIDPSGAVAELTMIGHEIFFDYSFREVNDKKYLFMSPKPLEMPSVSDLESRITVLMKFNLSAAIIQEVLNDVKIFEDTYMEVIHHQPEDVLQMRANYALVKAMIPEFDWDLYFGVILGQRLPKRHSFRVENIDGIHELITTVLEMPPRTLANYFFYHFLLNFYENSDSSQESCFEKTAKFFPSVLTLIVKNYFLTRQFRIDFRNILDDFDFVQQQTMDDDSSKLDNDIVDDLDKIWSKNYLQRLSNNSVNATFQHIQMSSDNYWVNLLEMCQHRARQRMRHLFYGGRKEDEFPDDFLLEHSIYQTHNKPMAVIFDVIGVPTAMRRVQFKREQFGYSQRTQNCFKRQLNDSSHVSEIFLIGVEAFNLYVRTFNRWTNKNWDSMVKEDDIFMEFGLNSKKLLFIMYMQTVCPYRNLVPELRDQLLMPLRNLKEFRDVYECANDTRMYSEEMCKI